MVRILTTICLSFFLSPVLAQGGEDDVVHTLFLVGDAGEPYVKDSPFGEALSEKIRLARGNSTVLFLGDNVYPRGLPDKKSPNYELAESSLQTQVGFIHGLDATGIFIPGNHDWQQWGRRGLEYLRNQQQWIDSLKDHRITLLPQNGCPGPVQVSLGDKSVLVILDTQWFLHQWDKPKDTELCNATTTSEVLTMVEDIFRSNPGKRIIIAAHHPLITYGEHGGIYTWKAHIFPLEEITKYLYIPLPVVGSIYPLYRRWFGHIQDTAHPVYKEFGKALQRIMAQYPGLLYVSGHEHALQYIVKDSTHYIVSGSAAKTEYVKQKGDAIFAKDINGFARVSIHKAGGLFITFFQVDEKYPEGKEVFSRSIPAVPLIKSEALQAIDFKEEFVRVKASDQYEAGKLKQTLLGKNYRSAWAQEIKVPVFDLGSEKGGLRILQKGGGQQTLSLRLTDSKGHEYVLRSVEKYPEAAIPEMLRETFAQDLVQDQISAAHPYAALVVAPMAGAVGLYHTNPRLVYIPDDPRFGEYRKTFANTLALFEERPDEDWSESLFFGNSEKIISTRKVLEKLADDNDNQVDEKFVLLNRLFDLIIGDWDRHDDQWRWATIEDKKDDVYRPIPRDRDQTFFVNEGILGKIWSRRWALPKFEGFDEDIRWPSGLSFNARHFDRSFLTGLSKEKWIKIAEDLKKDLTDEVIESSIRQWPVEIFELHGARIIQNLKIRRDNIVGKAVSHYEFLARKVDITGSDKTEAFEVERLPHGDLQVKVYKITKEGVRGKKLFDRIFNKRETKEIRLYGLKGEDIFEVSGSSKKSIRVRIIGGEDNDVLVDSSRVSGPGKETIFYDQTGQGKFQSVGEVRDRRAPHASVNEYNRTSFEYDRLAPLVFGNYNPDDGVFLGAGFLFLKHGFRKQPFSQRHMFMVNIAPLTQSYNFRYQGKFTDVIGQWDLELMGDVKAPNYVNNFFGMGNESVFNDDIDDEPGVNVDEQIQYYRYRFKEITVYPSLSRALGSWGNFKFGPMIQRFKMEEPKPGQDRFIEVYSNSLPVSIFDEPNTFGGLAWQFDIVNRDVELYTQRGSIVTIAGKNMAGLDQAKNFSSYEGSLAFFHSFRERSRVVFAVRVGGGFNRGTYPFYQAQVLGGKTEVRGFRKTRFYGDSKMYANFEVRIRLLSFRSYLFPASFGMLGFHDVGRIWYKNENGIDPSATDGRSDVWHKGWGGGLWFTPFNLTILSAEVGHSDEGTLGYVRLGFFF
ncbi:MAG: BamA/TamA family outer membrane protein [Cyclobacteriaceae bacterium]